MKKIWLSVCIPLIFALSGCSRNEDAGSQQKNYVEVVPKEIKLPDGQSVKFGFGIYSACIDNKAYVIGASKASDVHSVVDGGKPVSCLPKYKDKTEILQHIKSVDRGMFKMCIAGFEFIILAESAAISIKQEMNGQNAVLCVPDNKKNLNEMLFVHPRVNELMENIKKQEDAFKNLEEGLNDNKSPKIY